MDNKKGTLIFPKISRSISDFLYEEEGNISRSKMLYIGSLIVVVSIMLAHDEAFGSHYSHRSHASHSSHQSHQSGYGSYGSDYYTPPAHSNTTPPAHTSAPPPPKPQSPQIPQQTPSPK